MLKAKDAWPTTARVFCQQTGEPWPPDADVVDDLAVRSCRRRGIAIDLVLDRGRMNRSQFTFTRLKGSRPWNASRSPTSSPISSGAG